MPEAKRVLILTPTAELAERFRPPAEKLALSIVLGSADGKGHLRLDFGTRDSALTVVGYVQQTPMSGVVAVTDETAPVAARAASMLGLPFHTPKAADVCLNKNALAHRLQPADRTSQPAPNSSTEMTLHCIMSQGQLRVLAVDTAARLAPAAALAEHTKALIFDALKRTVVLLGLKHGPVRVVASCSAESVTISDVSCVYLPDAHASKMTFSIPLVDQDVFYEELVLRNALDLDTNRVLLTTNL